MRPGSVVQPRAELSGRVPVLAKVELDQLLDLAAASPEAAGAETVELHVPPLTLRHPERVPVGTNRDLEESPVLAVGADGAIAGPGIVAVVIRPRRVRVAHAVGLALGAEAPSAPG